MVDLKDFRGQWVVLYFYPKDMTQGCTIEAHNFQRDLTQYEAKKVLLEMENNQMKTFIKSGLILAGACSAFYAPLSILMDLSKA